MNKKRKHKDTLITTTQSFIVTCYNHSECNHFLKQARTYYHDIEQQVIEEENINKKTHYVFYHSQNTSNLLLQDVLDMLFSAPIANNFHYVRNPNKEKYKTYENVQHFLNANENIFRQSHSIPDLTSDVGDHLIAANVSLYSNYDAEGESSFHYFVFNRSVRNQTRKELISVCEEFGLDFCAKHVDEYLNWLFEQKEGLLLQIFIPKEFVNDITYVSQPGGIPIPSNIKTLEYIESYIQDIKDMNRLSDLSQIRILITKDILLNPNNNIKINRYTTIPNKKYNEYKNKLFNHLTWSWINKI